MKTLCIYHGNCADGFGAAWVVRYALGADNVDFHAGHYGKPAPDVEGRDVIIVDFSYSYELLTLLSQQARSILIIDHHKTAAEALAQLPTAPATYQAWVSSGQRVGTVFDMERSGAGLTWDYLMANQPRPALINHIEDRDLWRFALDGTREIQANLFSHPYDFDIWDGLMWRPISASIADGTAIERKHHKDVAELVAGSRRRMNIGGHDVPVANLPYIHSSDAGHLMARGEPFAACYHDTTDGRYFSLRSSDAGMDVGEIAKLYGGGGHRNAAGFKVPFDHELATGYVQPTLDSTEEPHRTEAAFNAVISYMLGEGRWEEPMEFLRLWNEGDFDALRAEWPDAPPAIYYADPLADHAAIDAALDRADEVLA